MEQKNHWIVVLLVGVLVLIIGVQGYLLHELRQRMDKFEGKSASYPVSSQAEPRSATEATEQTSQENQPEQQTMQQAQETLATQSEQTTTQAQASQQTAPPAKTSLEEITQPMPSQAVQPTFPVEVTEQKIQGQKDTARLAIKPSVTQPEAKPKSKVAKKSRRTAPEMFEEWMDEEPDFDHGYWDETYDLDAYMSKMFKDTDHAQVFDFDPTAVKVDMRVEDKGNCFEIILNTPDIDLSSIAVHVENKRFLKVSGMKNQVSETKDAATGMMMRCEEERHFMQGIFLPEPVNAKKIKLEMVKNHLKITLPKVAKN